VPEASPSLSVVVVTRDRAARLRAFLASLWRQTLPADRFEVVVVDDASTDGTQALVEGEAPQTPFSLRFVPVAGRPGMGALRNAGWRAAAGELVAFADDDCEAEPGWLEALDAAAREHPGAGVQGRTTPIPRELDRLGPLARTKWIETAGPWYQTCNIAYPRELLEQLGGFDPALRVAGEDTDLGWRAREAGAAITYEPRAHVRHAVEAIGVRGWLAIARRERVLVPVFARHPALRDEVGRLLLFKGDHALFAVAVAAVLAARVWRPLLALAVPYALSVARRCVGTRSGPAWAAWFVAYDAVAVACALGGAIENRVAFV
jgi:GT2 family glycosyltransferase